MVWICKNNFSSKDNADSFVFLEDATIVVQNCVASASATASSPVPIFTIVPVYVRSSPVDS
jgi:hypothetical protein